MTQQVELSGDQQALISSLIAEGVYRSAAEAVADGLRRIEKERRDHADQHAALQEAVRAGFDDVDAGNYLDISTPHAREEFWDAVRTELDARAAKRGHGTQASRCSRGRLGVTTLGAASTCESRIAGLHGH
ncbi:type II toxin-antitoxin system ParD family antitoxin [Nocardioides sp. AE5]|uniref:ribbon-helix-helix domain-containing protein n=1 Tax=Nocardioides sp. AE5 TaxID=2962573 RepID=UPI0028827179|nr:type II toxin-antitoxin system ParD family antitoxin [Nocardioides sp. AE5]MDT0200780.1 type II toxin-antitoxin system ParD family antitoxin [Nocardioides sp. AE5]